MKSINETNEGLLANLTPDQRDCVKCIDKNLEIVACAGAGKTHVLISRICRLVETGVNPDHILCITFTNAAALEMEERYNYWKK